jgi:DNA repair exonuclease SbcCD nuclease subunit
MRFVHTSDWHIGKTFRFAPEASQVLQDERLEAISRLGRLARTQGAAAVLVAGDIYDVQTPSERTLRQPLERMRAQPDIAWHLIPGNHDPHTPRGPWERLAGAGLPPNVRLHLTPDPIELAADAWLLPGVLTRRHAEGDPTAAMDASVTPPGAARIGLAHGSIATFGTDAASTHNRIAPDRPALAGLAYLALGDWHGAQEIGPRAWYAGTPETDDFGTGGGGGGEALLVELQGSAPPAVSRHQIGRFTWHRLSASLHNSTDIDVLETRLRGLSPSPETVLAWLDVDGTLSLAEREAFERRIGEGVASALRVLRLDAAGLLPRPTLADLEAIDHAGFVRIAADRLAARAGAGDAVAAAALQRLYVLHVRVG